MQLEGKAEAGMGGGVYDYNQGFSAFCRKLVERIALKTPTFKGLFIASIV